MAWNGLDLQTELSELLADTSSSFKVRVSRWINEIDRDIRSRFNWPFDRVKGKKLVTASQEEQSLISSSPSTPTATLYLGGSLVAGATYSVKITYYESVSGIETQPSSESSTVTIVAPNNSILVQSISTSSESLVTSRKVYLKKDSGNYYYCGTISNNTATDYTITADTTSKIEPPDYDYMRLVDGELFIETADQLTGMPIQSIRQYYSKNISSTSGTPNVYEMISNTKALVYPAPTSGLYLSFYYYKMPKGIYPSVDSVPDLPIWLKNVLVAGVEWKGYQFRDRSGKMEAFNAYNAMLVDVINRNGSPNKRAGKIRDVTGNSDGLVIV